MAYLDWIYSQEGQLLTNWGIEGESYTVNAEGNKEFIDSFLEEQGGLQASGMYQPGLTGVRMKDAYVSSLSENEAEALKLGLEYEGKGAPQHLLHYNEDEQFLYIYVTMRNSDGEIRSCEIFGNALDRIVPFDGDMAQFAGKEVNLEFI